MRQEERRLLKELYEDYSVPLKRFAASIGVHYDDIEDIVHDTIMDIMNAIRWIGMQN